MWDVILDAIAWLNQFYTTYKDTINLILSTLFSGAGFVVGGFLINQQRKKRQLKRQKEFSQSKLPFQLVKPNGDVYSLLYPPASDYKNPVLADRNIPYQRRIHEKNITQELYDLFYEHRWILIMGRTGIGKTREAAEVAQRLNNEGWTVLKLKLGEWLDRPNNEQLQAIGTDRKLLFLLDDLHQFMRRSENIEKHPEGKDNLAMPMNIPLQERLLDTLKAYENDVSDPQEIRVLGITRNEKEGYYPGQDSPYDKLQWDKYQKLWREFYVYEMPDPEDEAIVKLFQDTTTEAGIKTETNYIDLAVSNDGTFRNVVENLVSLDNQNLALNKQNFKETLQGTWDKRYKKAIERDKLAEFIYDGIDLLQQCNVPLNEVLVKETALLMVRGNQLQRLWCRFRLPKSLNRLIEIERILNPRDGQIEERGKRVDITDYLVKLQRLILKLFNSDSTLMTDALTNFSLWLYQQQHYEHCLKCYQKLVTVVKENAGIWFYLGTNYAYLKRHEEAILPYDKALEFIPNLYEAWYNRGVALDYLGRLDEAISSYDKAIEIKPDSHQAWNNRGVALGNLGRIKEAISSYDKAVEFKPDYHEAWYNRGVTFGNVRRLEEEISSYEKAIEIKPDLHQAWNNRGVALNKLGRLDEAIFSYDKALEIKLDCHDTIFNKALCYAKLKEVETCDQLFDSLPQDYWDNLLNDPDFQAIINDLHADGNDN